MSPPASAYSRAPIDGNLFASASVAIARKLEANSPSSVTTTESTRLLAMSSKARVNSLGLCARTTSTIKLKGAAASCIAGMIGLLTGLSGFDSAAAREMCGHASLLEQFQSLRIELWKKESRSREVGLGPREA